MYFGGKSRIIDFALSNAMNSGIRRIGVATQYKAHSLIRHLQRGWNFFRPERNESFDILPASASASRETGWYAGTADAVYQNIDIIESYAPRYIVLLAGDHVYKMDYEPMLQQHVAAAGGRDGRLHRGLLQGGHGLRRHGRWMPADRLTAFLEKPADPPGIPGRPGRTLASHGHLRVRHQVSDRQLAARCGPARFGTHDFGRDIIPYHREQRPCCGASFRAAPACAPRRQARSTGATWAQWTHTGQPTSTSPTSVQALDLYDTDWPIWTYGEITPPAKFVHNDEGRRGTAVDSLVSGGCIVSGSLVCRSLLCTGVHVHSFGRLENAVLMPYVDVGRGARLTDVVVDRGVRIPEGLVVGEDPALDAQRFRRTPRACA